jgi:site-specific recombinase XerD
MYYNTCIYELFVDQKINGGGIKMEWTLQDDKYMTSSEVKGLRKSTEDKALADLAKGRTTWPRIWMLIDIATCTGLRVQEMADLKVQDITISKEPFLTVQNGKGGRKRNVQIPDRLVKHIKVHIKRDRLAESDFLLTSSHGKGYQTRALQTHFKTACRVAGLPAYYSIHSCRHTYATLLYSATKDLREVQQQLGHSKPSTTAIYASATKEDISKDVNRVFNNL